MNNNNGDKALIWQEGSKKEVFKCPIFRVCEQESLSPKGEKALYSVIDSHDWVMVIPVIQTEHGRDFLMVRQWRHGSREMSLEFPGGVIEDGEDPAVGAAREMLEETGFKAGRLNLLARMSPNPATHSNHQYYYVAEDLDNTGVQHLDKDEFVAPERISEAELIANIAKPPFVHALVAAALCLYELKTHPTA
jgi:8-oxo-dGTP pyrophosphatase MutT (NUDIX family)